MFLRRGSHYNYVQWMESFSFADYLEYQELSIARAVVPTTRMTASGVTLLVLLDSNFVFGIT
jgi:hypothetical protein